MDQDTQPNQPKTVSPNQPVMDIQRPMAQPAIQNTPAPQPMSEQPIAPGPDAQEVGVPNYEQQHVALNKQVHKKRRGFIFLVIITVLVTLGLIGGAGYMYWQSKNKTEAPAQVDTAEQTTVGDGTLSPSDIDAATNEIDETINEINDSEDFGSNDLSDDGIGL